MTKAHDPHKRPRGDLGREAHPKRMKKCPDCGGLFAYKALHTRKRSYNGIEYTEVSCPHCGCYSDVLPVKKGKKCLQ